MALDKGMAAERALGVSRLAVHGSASGTAVIRQSCVFLVDLPTLLADIVVQHCCMPALATRSDQPMSPLDSAHLGVPFLHVMDTVQKLVPIDPPSFNIL